VTPKGTRTRRQRGRCKSSGRKSPTNAWNELATKAALSGKRNAKRAAEKAQAAAYAAKLGTGGFDEALARAVLYVVAAERALDERCAHALYAARGDLRRLPLDQYKTLVRGQFFVLLLERAAVAPPSRGPVEIETPFAAVTH
jgi:hypothetical protein